MRELDDDYIRLSVLTGYFAKVWDDILQCYHFQPKTIENRWDLTWERLEGWKNEAISLGVPEAETQTPEEVQALFRNPSFYKMARKLQEDRDRQTGHAHEGPAH